MSMTPGLAAHYFIIRITAQSTPCSGTNYPKQGAGCAVLYVSLSECYFETDIERACSNILYFRGIFVLRQHTS